MILYAIRDRGYCEAGWWYLETEYGSGKTWVDHLSIESCYLSFKNCLAEYNKLPDLRRSIDIVKIESKGKELIVSGRA